MKKGIALIELVVVVLVLGLLVGLSVPNYQRLQARIYQQIMINTLREMARYEKYSYLDSGSFFPKRIFNESFEFILYPDGATNPPGVSLQSMLYRFPSERKHIYYIYWFAPVVPANNGGGDEETDPGTGDTDDGDDGDTGNGDGQDDDNGNEDDEGDDDGNGNDHGDDEGDDEDEDDDDDDKNGKKDRHGNNPADNEDKTLKNADKVNSKTINVVSSGAYFCIYAYASKEEGNDLDGDGGQDVWYVDSYSDEPIPVFNDLE